MPIVSGGGGGGGAQPSKGAVLMLANTQAALGSGAAIPFDTVDSGTAAFLNSGSGIIIPAGQAGMYLVVFTVYGTAGVAEGPLDGATSTSGEPPNYHFPCTIADSFRTFSGSGSYIGPFAAGDTISVSVGFSVNPTIAVNKNNTALMVYRLGAVPT